MLARCLAVAAVLTQNCYAMRRSKGCGRLKGNAKHRNLLGRTTEQRGLKEFGDGTVERQWNIYVPSIYDPDVPAPIVLNFHGFTSSPAQAEERSGLIYKAGPIDALVRLLKGNADHADKQEAAAVFAAIARGSDERSDAIVRAGAVPPLVELLSSDSNSVTEDAALALSRT